MSLPIKWPVVGEELLVPNIIQTFAAVSVTVGDTKSLTTKTLIFVKDQCSGLYNFMPLKLR